MTSNPNPNSNPNWRHAPTANSNSSPTLVFIPAMLRELCMQSFQNKTDVFACLIGLQSIRPRVDPPQSRSAPRPPQMRSFRPGFWVVLPQHPISSGGVKVGPARAVGQVQLVWQSSTRCRDGYIWQLTLKLVTGLKVLGILLWEMLLVFFLGLCSDDLCKYTLHIFIPPHFRLTMSYGSKWFEFGIC